MDKIEKAKEYVDIAESLWGDICSKMDNIGEAVLGQIEDFQESNMDTLRIKSFSVLEGNLALQYIFLTELQVMMDTLEKKSGNSTAALEIHKFYLDECGELFDRCLANSIEKQLSYVENIEHVKRQIAVYGKYEINLLVESVATPLNTVALHILGRSLEFWNYGIPSETELYYIMNNIFVPFINKYDRVRSYNL
jgi:hypothetical protein